MSRCASDGFSPSLPGVADWKGLRYSRLESLRYGVADWKGLRYGRLESLRYGSGMGELFAKQKLYGRVEGNGNGAGGVKGKLRRPPMERAHRIHESISAGEYPNCAGLARKLEVSEKTVRRDVEYMRDHLELPIEFDFHRNGYFYNGPVDGFPGAARIGNTEMFTLVLAHKAGAQYQGTPVAESVNSGFNKLLASLGGVDRKKLQQLLDSLSVRRSGAEMIARRVLSAVATSVAERRGLEFSYRRPGETRVEVKQVLPYHVACVDGRFYLLGYDAVRR